MRHHIHEILSFMYWILALADICKMNVLKMVISMYG